MTPFLKQVAQHYKDVERLEDYRFVFPNRRSGEFFTHYLQREFAEGGKPHLLPRITSINELVAELTGTVAATDIEMMFALYDAYCQAMGDRAQEFDKFIYWAQLIISDYNDIDRSLTSASAVYRNLVDLHDLSANYLSAEVKEKVESIFGPSLFTAFFDTDADANLWRLYDKNNFKPQGDEDLVKQEFLNLWNALEDIYNRYHAALEAKGLVTSGRQLRMAAESTADVPQYLRLVFVGFGVLSAAEMKLMDRFNAAGRADFWWDNARIGTMLKHAPHDPGALLIDGYCKHFNVKHQLEPLDNEPPKVRVVSVSSMVGQAKQAFDEVDLMRGDGKDGWRPDVGIETAIVLPDESLLVPLLHSVHGVSRLNVTLGYPLRSSGIVSLMHIVARMHHQASKDHDVCTYYRDDVNDILSHPLIKTYFTSDALDKVADLIRANRFRVPASDFDQVGFADLFVPAMNSDEPGGVMDGHQDYLSHLLNFCNELMDRMKRRNEKGREEPAEPEKNGVEVPLQQAFLLSYIDVLTQLKHALADCQVTLSRSTVFYMIDRLTSSSIVPFTGEPLQGLQIMGLLETRSLDFENVVILSMNERIFPRRRGINSFIPNYMRRALGMSTIEQQEAIVSYNFYRLLNRSRRVTLIYDSSAKDMGSTEPSRFITQLEKIYGVEMEYVEMSPSIDTSSSIEIQAPALGNDVLRSRYTSAIEEGGKYLSASAINKYIGCPLKFYFVYIQGMSDDSDMSDFMDYSTFGTIVHDTLSDCYNQPGIKIDEDYLKNFKQKRLEASVVWNIKKDYLRVPEGELNHDIKSLSGESLMLVDTIKSYVCFVLDYDLDLIRQHGPFTVVECEKTHNIPLLEIGGEKFNFTYKPDRIDRIGDRVRIIDYKTGSDKTYFLLNKGGANHLFEEGSSRRKAILQLFLYCYAYLSKHDDITQVEPVIYKIPSMKESGVIVKLHPNDRNPQQYVFSMNDEVAQDFMAQLGSTVKRIFEGDFGQAPEGSDECNRCRFTDFCRRTPTKQN